MRSIELEEPVGKAGMCLGLGAAAKSNGHVEGGEGVGRPPCSIDASQRQQAKEKNSVWMEGPVAGHGLDEGNQFESGCRGGRSPGTVTATRQGRAFNCVVGFFFARAGGGSGAGVSERSRCPDNGQRENCVTGHRAAMGGQ